MIERTTVEGKPATVAYLKGDFVPATKEDCTFVKVIFDDGNVMFATKEKGKANVKDAV